MSSQIKISLNSVELNQGYHPDERMLEVDWPGHSSRSFHCENSLTMDARRETQEGLPQDHVVTDSRERNQGDGEDLGWHQAYGKGSADVEEAPSLLPYMPQI